METYIEVINNYFRENKIIAKCPNVESLLDMLFCCYNQRNRLNTDTIRQSFSQLDAILGVLALQKQDQVIDLTCDLCGEYQKDAFREGMSIGFRLYKELQEPR